MGKPELVSISKALYEASQRLEKAAGVIFTLGREKAEAEHLYRMELAKEILRLRAEGTPATLINDVARGNKADLKLLRDAADAKYDAAKSSLRATETQCSVLQSLLRVHETM